MKNALTLWPHSGISAPSVLTIDNYRCWADANENVGYVADVVHPNLGLLGQMSNNDGRHLVTDFHYADRARFWPRDMEVFLKACTKDGRPVGLGDAGMTTLLEDALYEHETDSVVRRTRQRSGIVVRDRLNYPPQERRGDTASEDTATTDTTPLRGDAIGVKDMVLSPAGRAKLAARLHEHTPTPPQATHEWELFNGRTWVPLVIPEPGSARRTARMQAIQTLHQDGPRYLRAAPADEFHVSGPLAWRLPELGERGVYVFLGDDSVHGSHHLWCQCDVGPRARLVRLEEWTVEDGLVAAGYLHAAKTCRGLVTVD